MPHDAQHSHGRKKIEDTYAEDQDLYHSGELDLYYSQNLTAQVWYCRVLRLNSIQ
jgi:hypothetical protein